jgi:hypothetical protein
VEVAITSFENLNLPDWALYLMELGMFVSDRNRTRVEGTETFVVCLPRIEYAAVFLTMGAVLESAPRLSEASGIKDQIQTLLGQDVVINTSQGPKVGRLHEIISPPDSYAGYIRLLQKETERGTVRRKVKLIDPKSIQAIAPLGTTLNLTRRPTKRQIERFGERGDCVDSLREAFGESAANWIVSGDQAVATILGVRKRIEEECEEYVPLRDSDRAFMVKTVLKPSCIVQYADSYHVRVESSRKAEDIDGGHFYIIEPDAAISDFLRISRDSVRVVLLNRSASSYSCSADVLLQEYGQRNEEVEHPLPPETIKTLAFTSC